MTGRLAERPVSFSENPFRRIGYTAVELSVSVSTDGDFISMQLSLSNIPRA